MENDIDIEKEVQARVQFKMNEFKSVIKNAVGFKYRQAFDMTQKSQHVWEAFEEFEKLFNKEVMMATPYDDMYKRKQWEAKEKAIKEMRKELENKFRGILRGQDFEMLIRRLVTHVETAQNY